MKVWLHAGDGGWGDFEVQETKDYAAISREISKQVDEEMDPDYYKLTEVKEMHGLQIAFFVPYRGSEEAICISETAPTFDPFMEEEQ